MVGEGTFWTASLRLLVVFLATPFFFWPSMLNFFRECSSSKGLGAASAAGLSLLKRSGILRFFLEPFFAMLLSADTERHAWKPV